MLDRYAPSENRYFFTKNTWSSILSEIVSQPHIGAVNDVVKFQIRFFRLSAAEKTHNQVVRVLQFLPGLLRLWKIAIFSLKTFGL